MRQEIRSSWYEDFSCVGGSCTYNCCRSDWKKDVTEAEYETFRALEHPYRETILDNIEERPGGRCFRMREGHCGLLTPEGWCGIVRECGEGPLPGVCRTFPRAIADYGAAVEHEVEIACPYVAERLFEREPIQLHRTGDAAAGSTVYGALASSRDCLVGLFQKEPGTHTYGKLYLLYALLYRLRDEIRAGGFAEDAAAWHRDFPETAARATALFRSEALVAGVFAQDAQVRDDRSRQCQAIRNTQILQETIGFARSEERVIEDDAPWAYLREAARDEVLLSAGLDAFLAEQERAWPLFTEQYFVHALSQDWIDLNPGRFGNRLLVRSFAYTLTVMLGMAELAVRGSLPIPRYARIVSWAERMIIHNRAVPGVVLGAMEQAGIRDAAGVLTLLV